MIRVITPGANRKASRFYGAGSTNSFLALLRIAYLQTSNDFQQRQHQQHQQTIYEIQRRPNDNIHSLNDAHFHYISSSSSSSTPILCHSCSCKFHHRVGERRHLFRLSVSTLLGYDQVSLCSNGNAILQGSANRRCKRPGVVHIYVCGQLPYYKVLVPRRGYPTWSRIEGLRRRPIPNSLLCLPPSTREFP